MPKTNKKTEPKNEKANAKSSKDDVANGDSLNHARQIEIPLEIINSKEYEVYDNNSTLIEQSDSYGNAKDTFSISNDIFIEVHKSNLLQYFSAGCIFPALYSSQKAFSDPQSINVNGLLISNGLISDNEDHLLIQIDPFAIDRKLLSVKDAFGIYSGIIPVSRIMKIYVSDIETKKKTIDDSLIRDVGFIPESLIGVGFPLNIRKGSVIEFSISSESLEPKLNQFDKILGLIAGTRNFNLLTYNQTEKYKSISDHALLAIQAIDETFASEIVKNIRFTDYYRWLFANSCPKEQPLLQWLFNRVYDNSNFTDKDTNEFEALCQKTNSFQDEEKQVKIIFNALKKSLERKKAMTDILALQSKNSLALYVFAYLRNFGTNQNPELPRVELVTSNVNKYSECAFATLNFFFGYKQLRNTEDRLNINNEIIKKLIKIPVKPAIKFELTTEFDYRIIDAVFNLVFGIQNIDITKYNNISNELAATDISIDGYECYSNVIYGKIYHRILKSNIEEQLKNLPNEIAIFSEFGLVCHRLGLKRNLISLEELIGNPKSILRFVYYSKADLIEAVKTNKIDKEELRQRIVFSQKHKEI